MAQNGDQRETNAWLWPYVCKDTYTHLLDDKEAYAYTRTKEFTFELEAAAKGLSPSSVQLTPITSTPNKARFSMSTMLETSSSPCSNDDRPSFSQGQ